MTHAFRSSLGDDWLAQVLKPEAIARLHTKQIAEAATRQKRGAAKVSDDLLDYTEFYQLIDLANSHWQQLAACLGEKKLILPLLERFNGLRNTVAHNRDLLPHERDLISGIAGDIRNRVTLYMSTQDPTGDHYGRIESVTDGFGNRTDAAQHRASSPVALMTGTHLQVGDTVTFTCRGTDPHGRQITWHLQTVPGEQAPVPVPVPGGDAEVQWLVQEQHIGQQTAVLIEMRSDSAYHRFSGSNEGQAMFFYSIDPPN